MAALVLGLVVVLGLHSLKIVAPDFRGTMIARIGEMPFRGVYSLISIIGLVLIVWGFGQAWQSPTYLYSPPNWGRHLAMTLMIPALILVFASIFPAKWIKCVVRHPLLVGTMLWAVAHLSANGDLAGVVLFAAFLAWAVFDFFAQPSAASAGVAVKSPGKADLAALVAGVALYGIMIAGLHFWLFGVSPA